MRIAKNGVVRGNSSTRQTLNDAWDATNWDGSCDTPWEMVAPELKLRKKVTADMEGAGPPLPRIVVERTPEVEPRRFYVLSADTEAHGHPGDCLGCASDGRTIKPHNNECRERTIIGRTSTGKAWMNAHKDRVAETERVKERKRARVERGAGDVLVEPENEEQMTDRHAFASGEKQKQHEEKTMRDVHSGERGSETANEEQPDKLRKTVRFEQEAPNTSSSSTMHVSPEYLASGARQDRPEPVLVQNPGHVDDDVQISSLDVFYEMDGRESRYIKAVLDG